VSAEGTARRLERSAEKCVFDVSTGDELAQAEMLGDGGRQEESRISQQAVVVEGHIEPAEAVG
jgi:hypothetical protein